MKESGVVKVDRTDIGASDHFLVWCEWLEQHNVLTKGKRVITWWDLEQFGDDEVKTKYQEASSGCVKLLYGESSELCRQGCGRK